MNELDFEQDARKVDELPAAGLSKVSTLAQRQLQLEEQLKGLADQQEMLTKQLTAIAEEQLPEAMLELGISKIKLADGSEVEVSTSYYAGIPERNKQEAFNWLREHNLDALIKNEITAVFGKGEDQKALRFMQLAKGEGVSVKDKANVHSQTLRALVKEKIEEGSPLPETLFGVHVVTRAVIRR